MTRPKWLAHATALPRRHLSSSPSRRPRDPSRWQVPGRAMGLKPRSLLPDVDEEKEAFAAWRNDAQAALSFHEKPSRKHILEPVEQAKPDTRTMVRIKGLIPSLKAADFHRQAAAKELADWSQAIVDVIQERNPWTLEPWGTYRVTFSNRHSAVAFCSNFKRILRLSHLKLQSANGLWMSQVPVHDRSSNLEEELQAFTIAPGSLPEPEISISTPKLVPWLLLVNKLVAESPYPTSNGVVLLHLQNPCMVAQELMRFINQDGHDRNQAWRVHKPYHLTRTLHEETPRGQKLYRHAPPRDTPEFQAKLRSRFVIVCENEDVASRFVRTWNQRTLTANSRGYTQRTLVNSSLIEW
ncbi:Fc.00g091260.m01.CDS01 [Cosmosporella sp. VM-42]